MGAAGIGVTEKEDGERRIDQQHVFHHMAFFLAAIIVRLLGRVLGRPRCGGRCPRGQKGGTGAFRRGRIDEVGNLSGGTTMATVSSLLLGTFHGCAALQTVD